MNQRFNTLAEYHEHWKWLILDAPSEFRSHDDHPVNQSAALEDAYDALEKGFVFVERKIRDTRQIAVLRELIAMSHEVYLAGGAKSGAHML